MKNYIFGFLITLSLFSFKNSIAARTQPSDFEFVGIGHNEKLDFIYNYIVENNINNSNKNLVINALKNKFTEENNYSTENMTLALNNIENAFSNPPNLQNNLYSNVNSPSLTIVVKNYLDQLFTIINLNLATTTEFNLAVTNLENTINNDAILDNEKLSILYIATNIAKYSFNYWTTNSNKWKLLNTNNTNTDPGLRYIIVKADIAGGLVGAGTAWMSNFVPGAGQVAYGSAILIGAAGCSGYEASIMILNWIWD
jgi:hypothetical protein